MARAAPINMDLGTGALFIVGRLLPCRYLQNLESQRPAFAAPRVFDYPISSAVLAPRVPNYEWTVKAGAHSPDGPWLILGLYVNRPGLAGICATV
jgi:hypothetical protein